MSISVGSKGPSLGAIDEDLLADQTCTRSFGSDGLRWKDLFLNGVISLKSTGGTERRLRENAGALEATDATPTVLTQLAPFFQVVRSAATDPGFRALVSGDTQPRFEARADGRLAWGAGGASATDIILERKAASVLGLDDTLRLDLPNATDEVLQVRRGTATDNFRMQAGGLALWNAAAQFDKVIDVRVAGNTFRRFGIDSDGNLEWGLGASTPSMFLVNFGSFLELDALIVPVSDDTIDLGAVTTRNWRRIFTVRTQYKALSADPTSPVVAEGQVWYRTDIDALRLRLTSSTVTLATTSGTFGAILRSPSGEAQRIQPLTDNVPLTIRANASQTADLFVVENSGGTVQFVRVDSGGLVFVTDGVSTTLLQPTGILTDRIGPAAADPFIISDLAATPQIQVSTASPQVAVQNNFRALGFASLGGLAPVSNTGLRVSPVAGSTGAYTLANFNSNAYSIGGAAFRWVLAGGAITFTASGGSASGLEFQPSVAVTGGITVASYIPVQSGGTLIMSGAGTGTFTEVTLYKTVLFPTVLGGIMAITTLRHIWLQTIASTTTLTTAVGLDIDALPTATTAIGIRQSGTVETNRLSGNTRIGDQTAPTHALEVAGQGLATGALVVFQTTAFTSGSLGSLICPLKTAAGTPTDTEGGNLNGAFVVSSGDDKLYARVGGLWKGVAIAGFSIPQNEMTCPACGFLLKPGDRLVLLADRYYVGGDLHAVVQHYQCPN